MRRDCPTWTEALRRFIDQADKMGALVMVSGVVLNNIDVTSTQKNSRFRDGRSTRAPGFYQWRRQQGGAACSRSLTSSHTSGLVPRPCPIPQLAVHRIRRSRAGAIASRLNCWFRWRRCVRRLAPREALVDTLARLARVFKVSTLVILRRLFDAGQIAQTVFRDAYATELRRLADLRQASGGDFYRTTTARVSRRFGRALVESTLEGPHSLS